MGASVSDVRALLDAAHKGFSSLDCVQSFNLLVDGLAAINRVVGNQIFVSRVTPMCRSHAIWELCQQEPVTRHAIKKPRGYAGDAELIDYYYGLSGPQPTDTPLGRQLYRGVYSRSGGESLRWRRALLARCIDNVADRWGGETEIMSIAAGHFREGQLSQALAKQRLKRILCFDQDRASLKEVRRSFPSGPVETLTGSVRTLLDKSSSPLGHFHLIYAAGLYDYLEARLAARLTARLFSMLRPRGRLVLANFAPETSEQGYMCAFMDWHLKYRSEKEVDAFCAELGGSDVARKKLFRDEPGNVIYIELVRA